MQRIIDVYLACWCIAAIALLAGFTLSRAIPPDWVFGVLAVSLVLALAGVIASNRIRRQE